MGFVVVQIAVDPAGFEAAGSVFGLELAGLVDDVLGTLARASRWSLTDEHTSTASATSTER